ncbi:MAG: hypothetical protein VKL23_03500 [Cyanobacteriota bacterium]|jgi:hypothetical protein|nr:hypothetical protein [Cyanobacteriota bacterium]
MVRQSAVFVLLSLITASAAGGPAAAQVQKFMLGPGSYVGPETKVVPQDCVTAPDGSITCDTKVVNPPGTTKAKPVFSPWDQ